MQQYRMETTNGKKERKKEWILLSLSVIASITIQGNI